MKFTLGYLASPYAKYPGGLERAFQDTSRLMARLIVAGYPVYSPICHSHSIATHGLLDHVNYEIWLPFNEAMMNASDALLVAMLPTWQESRGIQHETDWFRRADKPVYMLCPETLAFSEEAFA